MKLVVAAIVGLTAFTFTWFADGKTRDAAEVVLIVDQDEVVWPHHDSVRFEAAGALQNDPEVLTLVRNVAGESATVDARLFNGQSHLLLTVAAGDERAARRAADAAAAWVTERSLETRRAVAHDRLNVLEQHRGELIDRLAAMDEETSARSALEERVAVLDADIDEEATRRDLLRPQIRAAGSARSAGANYSPWLAMIAGLAAGLAVVVVIER